jgi:hypothetical protein
MIDHPAIRGRVDNIVFVRFRRRDATVAHGSAQGRTCRSCAHWCEDEAGLGRCLADCGARMTTPDRQCGEWRRPPLLTLV